MPNRAHLIGKCLFQIDIPGHGKEQAVYETISALGKEKLPALLDEWLDTLECPPGTWLQIDRLELKLGDLQAEHFEQELLQGIQRALGDQLHLVAQKNAKPPLSEEAQLAAALAHFFKHGHFPWWAKHLTNDPNPAALLAALATTNEAQAQALLREWLQNPTTRRRMAHQLSAGQLRQSLYLIEAAFAEKATAWANELLQLFQQSPVATPEQTEKWIWAALLDWAARQESTDLPFSTPQTVLGVVLPYFAGQTNRHLPNIRDALLETAEQNQVFYLPWTQALRTYQIPQTATTDAPKQRSQEALKAPPPSNVNPSEAKAAPGVALTTPVGALPYFLEWGRLPLGSTATLAQLEQDLLAFIQENPEQAALALLGLNKKTNLAARLAQQFSKAVYRATIRLFFPESWEALASLMANAFAPYRNDLSEALVWETALRQLLLHPDAPVDMPLLLQQMAQHLAAKLNLSPDALLLQMQTTTDDTELRQTVDRTLGRLTEAEESSLSAELQRWLPPESLLTLETAPNLVERIRYRLTHGNAAWWDDDPALSLEALLRALAALAPDARREGFMALWAADLREKWLPRLPEAVFYQILHDFWGDYASLAALSASALADIAAEKAITLPAQGLRDDFLALALSGRTVDTALLLATALHGFARQTSIPLQTWTNWLTEKAESATTAGDIRYYRLRSVLRESLEPAAPIYLFPPSETQHPTPNTQNPTLKT